MNIVLLSGGSGKRLWPLSNEIRSKQFLKLLSDANGSHESMVQRVYRQITQAGIQANIVVATSATQVESIKGQLPDDVDVVVEPERRNTFSCNRACRVVSGIPKADGPGGDRHRASRGPLCGGGIF